MTAIITASEASLVTKKILIESRSMNAFLTRLDAYIHQCARQCKSSFTLCDAYDIFAAEGIIEWDEKVLGTNKLPSASVKYITDVLTANGYAIKAVNGPSGNTIHVSW